MKRRLLSLPVWLLIPSILGLSTPAAGAPEFEMSSGSEYSSLKLTDGSTSTIWYAPLSARLDIGNWTVRATIPYVSITAPQDLIVLLDDDPTGAGVGSNGRAGSTTDFTKIRTVSGIGDSALSATYSFDDIAGSPLYVDLGARIRLPTGNAHEGTGIGATDYGLQSEVGMDLERWGIALNGGRRYLGKVGGLERVDGWQAGSDAWLNLGPHALMGVYYDWRDASERDLSNPRDVGVYLSYRLNRRWKVRLDTSRALDLPTANYTIALTIYWRLHERRDHH
jgi:hypothetical protein